LITVLYAHPHADRSVGGRVLLEAVRDIAGVSVRPLYDLYPDFAIDVAAERAALDATRLLVWQHPLHWYGVPALLKLWFDDVLADGWAFGSGHALAGKDCLWVTTTGGGPDAFAPTGRHGHPFEAFVAPVEQIARFCRMNFLPPVVVYGSHQLTHDALQRHADAYRALLTDYQARHG
jgi:glutathione-regulated potassium-efflux system ancillary protein KefF